MVVSYQQNRVYVSDYGTLAANSPLLVPVPTIRGKVPQKLHMLAAHGFSILSGAAQKDLGFPLLVASGWRPHRWKSWEEYVAAVVKQYGSLEKGRKYKAFDSPHETGLAIDLGCGGLLPKSTTIPAQKKTPLFKWLVANAWLYGWTPYFVEPWHWEYKVPIANYKSGESLDHQDVVAAAQSHPDDICEDESCERHSSDLMSIDPKVA